MNILKTAFASAAAAALLASQGAAAAPVPARAASPTGPVEALGGGLPDGSAPVITIISLLALVALIAVIADGDDDDGVPVSP